MKIRVSPKEGFTLIELLVVISIIAILAGIALPAFTGVIERGNQTKVLSNAKQIYLGLKMFAGDYDGLFPSHPPTTSALNSTTGTTPVTAANANAAYRNLVPTYVPTEKIFWIPKDGFCSASAPADDPNAAQTARLPAGTNHFAYVAGLNDTSPPAWPLIADAFVGGAGTVAAPAYTTTPGVAGGLWKGKAAVVVRVDGSGKVERLTLDTFEVKEKIGTSEINIFTPNTGLNWLTATGAVVLNPDPAL